MALEIGGTPLAVPTAKSFSVGGLITDIFAGVRDVITDPRTTQAVGTYLQGRAQQKAQDAANKTAAQKADRDYALVQRENDLRQLAIQSGYGYDPSAYLSSRYLGVTPDAIYYGGGIRGATPTAAGGTDPLVWVAVGVGLLFIVGK